jgi:hypothetical protein
MVINVVCHIGERPALQMLVPIMYGMASLQCPEHSDVSLTQHRIEHLQIEKFINV